MDWHNELAAELPAPRDDEPASLRQDILDELSDHIDCAVRRELHRTADLILAQRNALSRFGEPRAVARRLWLDAMKEKLMSQRITIVLTGVLTVTCLAATALVWRAIETSREVNLALVDRLEGLAAPPAAAVSDWIPVRRKLVLGEEGGPPAAGFRVTISRGGNEAEPFSVAETSGSDGSVDFGLLRYGQYSVSIEAPWDEYGSRVLQVRPGTPAEGEIVCPAEAPPLADVTVAVEWPDDLREKQLYAVLRLTAQKRTIEDSAWSLVDNDRSLIVTSQGMARLIEDEELMELHGADLSHDQIMKGLQTSVSLPERGYAVSISFFRPSSPVREDAHPSHVAPAVSPLIVHSNTGLHFRADAAKKNHWAVPLDEGLLENLRMQFD